METDMQPIKIIVEKQADGYVAYPLGLKGIVVGEGDTYEEALDDIKSALRFHIETFGPDLFDTDTQALEAFVAEVEVACR
jgi:predicted RNase H-like HicB family nuclease